MEKHAILHGLHALREGAGPVGHAHTQVAQAQRGRRSSPRELADNDGSLIRGSPVMKPVIHGLVQPVDRAYGTVGGAEIGVELKGFLNQRNTKTFETRTWLMYVCVVVGGGALTAPPVNRGGAGNILTVPLPPPS